MRSRIKDLQDVWFVPFEEKLDKTTGELSKEYGKPEKRRMSVSATSGHIYSWGAGFALNYDRFITCYDRHFKPEEGIAVFVDVIPELDKDGNLATTEKYDPILGEYNTEYVTTPDYILKRVLDTQKGSVARFGIEKV